MRPSSLHRSFLVLLALLAVASFVRPARADQLVIKRPGAHTPYAFEAEPHLLVGPVDPPGPGRGSGFGVGFRGTVVLADRAFISKLNNSVGIGFGLDWVFFGDARDCVDEDLGPGQRIVCGDRIGYFWAPVVLQWNFFLSKNWSVFAEPGLALRITSPGDLGIDPFVMYLGGRWHFSDNVTLTMRIGYPTFSVGVSFLM
ncbi:MAG TPA: hypothetical protein VF989_09395 [Polyangiaceae bacterium]